MHLAHYHGCIFSLLIGLLDSGPSILSPQGFVSPTFPGLSNGPADILQLPPLESPIYRCGCPPIRDDIVLFSLVNFCSLLPSFRPPSFPLPLSRAIRVTADSLQLLLVDSCPQLTYTPLPPHISLGLWLCYIYKLLNTTRLDGLLS